MVPAWAATMLKEAGHDVIWNDCIAMRWPEEQFWEFINRERPDLIALETKTPVVKIHWDIIKRLKADLPAETTTSCWQTWCGTWRPVLPWSRASGTERTAR
jgi:hypothetical protein